MSDDFLSRWSRRKSEAREAAPVPSEEAAPEAEHDPEPEGDDAPAPVAADVESAAPLEEMSAEEVAALPPVEELTSDSDLAPFLRAGVPTFLRNAALRRMWALDPAIRDFLNDAREYAYDWNTPGGAPGLGPLLPSDDVKAMVRCIFDGRAARPEPEEATATDGEEPATPPRDGAEDDQPPEKLNLFAGVPHASAPAEDRPLEAPAAGGGLASSEPKPSTDRDPEGAAGSTRARRHGGATPA